MTLEIFFNSPQRSNWPFSQVVFDEMKWFSDSSPPKVITFDQPSSQYDESNWIKRDYLLKIGFGYTLISKEITVVPIKAYNHENRWIILITCKWAISISQMVFVETELNLGFISYYFHSN